jgi:hypothetical protein
MMHHILSNAPMLHSVSKLFSCHIERYKGNTFALKTVRESNVSIDLELSGMIRCRRQTNDTYCPRFRESPTNSIRLPRSISSIRVALKLQQKTFSTKILYIKKMSNYYKNSIRQLGTRLQPIAALI